MFNLNDYETVAQRVIRFQKAYPTGRIVTRITFHDPLKGEVTAEASVYRNQEDTLPAGVDSAFGVASTYPKQMAKFYVEDTLTSATGRALSLILEVTHKPTREDMEKVQAHAEVKSLVEQTKARMAQTAKEYVPIAKEDDPWTIRDAEPAKTVDEAVAMVKDIIGGQTERDIPNCKCGKPMAWKTGVGKNNKPWGHFKCSIWSKATGAGCDVVNWYEVAADGTWKPQEKKW
jgi:hypothetical protein